MWVWDCNKRPVSADKLIRLSNYWLSRSSRLAVEFSHLIHIFDKLGVGDRTQAVSVAIQRGIVHVA